MQTCESIYQHSRKSADFTQESAAEFLHISPRTLGSYETGACVVPDDIVNLMVDLYHDPMLGYLHLLRKPLDARYLPEVEDKSLSQAALSLICAAGNYMAQQSRMVLMCADGKIDNTEEKDWEEVNEAIDQLIKAAYTLRFARRD